MPCAAAGPSTAGPGLAAAATLTAVNEEMASTEHSAEARTTSLRIIDASRTTRPHRTPRPVSRTYQTPDRQQPLTSRPNQARARPARDPGHRASSTATSPIAVMAYTAEIDQQIEANE